MQIINCRDKLSFSYLKGKGVEFGALHNPLITDLNLTKVMYADKFDRKTLVNMFSELGSNTDLIVNTDIYLDINTDNLETLATYNFDFFIANHVLEHLGRVIN